MENENNAQINQPEMPETVNEIQPEKKGRSCPLRPSTVINVILVVAVGVLYFLHFYGGKTAKTAADASTGPLKVAYFDTDTVFQKYLLVDELREGLKKSKDSLEGIFNTKQATFEGKVKNYQNNLKSNAINATQAQNAEAQLMREREEIMQTNEIYTQHLVAKESEINRRITEDIIAYANLFNKTYGADYILGYTKGGPIIVVNEKLDVTKDIIEGLNKEYNNKKGK